MSRKLQTGGLRGGSGLCLSGLSGDGTGMHADEGKTGTADAIGEKDSKGQRGEAGTN